MNPFNLVLILFTINLMGLISFYIVDLGYDGHLDLTNPIALIAVTMILGIGVIWGTAIRNKQQANHINV